MQVSRTRHPAILGLFLLLAGCATHEVVVGIDMLSFVEEVERRPVEFVRTAASPNEPQTLEPQVVELLEGMGGVVEVTRVDLTLELAIEIEVGSGAADIALYVAAAGDPTFVYQTEPVARTRTPLRAGGEELVRLRVSSQEVTQLRSSFASGAVVIGLAMWVTPAEADAPISGQWQIQALDATVEGATRIAL